MGDDGYTASQLRQRYSRGGSVADSELSAAQLRSRYTIPSNTFKDHPVDTQNKNMMIGGAVIGTALFIALSLRETKEYIDIMDDYDKAAQLRKRYNKEKNICDPKEDKAKDVKLKDRISIDAQYLKVHPLDSASYDFAVQCTGTVIFILVSYYVLVLC